jgi:hypothetical protein
LENIGRKEIVIQGENLKTHVAELNAKLGKLRSLRSISITNCELPDFIPKVQISPLNNRG